MWKKVAALITLGSALRLWLAQSSLADWLKDRAELATPLTSWKRTVEGLALKSHGISPYEGAIYHEPPLVLGLFGHLVNWSGGRMDLVFIALDAIIALALWRVTKHLGTYLLRQQAADVSSYHTSARRLILRSDSLRLSQLYVVSTHMFNPFSIASCIAQSTGLLSNLFVVLALLFALRGNRLFTCAFVAAATYQSLYPAMLLIPAALLLVESDQKRAVREARGNHTGVFITSLVQTTICAAAALVLLLYSSFSAENSTWDFVTSTYWFILSVPELTPNVGLFWYFFTEMFDHFRSFFLCVFQIHAFVYLPPLTVKLQHRPEFLFYVLVALQAIVKSYPSYSDVALYLSMLPMWRHTLRYTRNSFLVVVTLIVGVFLAPVQWHLWIETGTANANFYFAMTLVISTSQIFLVTDLLFAYLRREYELFNGTKTPKINGKKAAIILD